jgi:transposase
VIPLLPEDVKIYIATEPADLRRSFDGLAGIVRGIIKKDPMSGHLFVFRNKAGHRVKILFWDRTGFCLHYKRLERGIFRFPTNERKSMEVKMSQLRMLLDGIPLGCTGPLVLKKSPVSSAKGK